MIGLNLAGGVVLKSSGKLGLNCSLGLFSFKEVQGSYLDAKMVWKCLEL